MDCNLRAMTDRRWSFWRVAFGILVLVFVYLMRCTHDKHQMQTVTHDQQPIRTDTHDMQPIRMDANEHLYRMGLPPLRGATPECELKTPHYFSSQAGEDYFVLKSYFSKPLKCGGTFVEMGAYNGITLSVSLFFEKYLNWRGLLVEANPDNYKLVLQNRPNTTAFGLAAGYCPEGHIKFNGGGGGGNIIDEEMNPLLKADGKRVIEVPCVPLGGLLRRAGLQSIDLFILDVEGAEYSALTTMDWSIPVKVWVVEVNHSDRQQIIDIFAEHGYYKDSIDITQMCRDHHAFLDKDPAFISERGIQCTPSYIFRKK